MARVYNTAALILALGYLVRRAATTKGILYRWGLRTDNFWAAVRGHSAFWMPATAALLLWGAIQGKPLVPRTIWVVLLLYPFFGIGQQFVLQNLLASHLRALLQKPVPCAFVAALLFGLAHLPRTEISVAAFVAALCLTLAHQRHPGKPQTPGMDARRDISAAMSRRCRLGRGPRRIGHGPRQIGRSWRPPRRRDPPSTPTAAGLRFARSIRPG